VIPVLQRAILDLSGPAVAGYTIGRMQLRFAKSIALCVTLLSLPVQPAFLRAQDEKPQLPEGPGKATALRLCSTCHGAQVVLGKPHSEDGWGAIVADMVQRGAPGTDDELYEVVQYLTKYIKAGPVMINVNKATAKQLETGLKITAKEAEAIVQTREKGAFKSVEDVKKVPGIDASKIEAKKNLLMF
jgi:competence protein ComEA